MFLGAPITDGAAAPPFPPVRILLSPWMARNVRAMDHQRRVDGGKTGAELIPYRRRRDNHTGTQRVAMHRRQ